MHELIPILDAPDAQAAMSRFFYNLLPEKHDPKEYLFDATRAIANYYRAVIPLPNNLLLNRGVDHSGHIFDHQDIRLTYEEKQGRLAAKFMLALDKSKEATVSTGSYSWQLLFNNCEPDPHWSVVPSALYVARVYQRATFLDVWKYNNQGEMIKIKTSIPPERVATLAIQLAIHEDVQKQADLFRVAQEESRGVLAGLTTEFAELKKADKIMKMEKIAQMKQLEMIGFGPPPWRVPVYERKWAPLPKYLLDRLAKASQDLEKRE